jgi:hypothetical protein
MDHQETESPNECHLIQGKTALSAQFVLFSAVAAILIYKWWVIGTLNSVFTALGSSSRHAGAVPSRLAACMPSGICSARRPGSARAARTPGRQRPKQHLCSFRPAPGPASSLAADAPRPRAPTEAQATCRWTAARPQGEPHPPTPGCRSAGARRLAEKPRRPSRIWFLDVSKQVVSTGAAHLCGMTIAIIVSGQAHRASQCAW